jgi:hypothetical protein
LRQLLQGSSIRLQARPAAAVQDSVENRLSCGRPMVAAPKSQAIHDA